MASATEFSQRMAQVLVANPDRRTRKHKQAVKEVYESTIASLIVRLSEETTRNNELRANELRARVAQRARVVAHANRDDEPTPSCSICMEDMRGRVTLVCGHEMCPDCFAQHSRVNNTCPFCREEFAPKPRDETSEEIRNQLRDEFRDEVRYEIRDELLDELMDDLMDDRMRQIDYWNHTFDG